MSTETNTTTATPVAPVASPSKVFIGNLAFELTEEDLTNEFSAYGKVVLARIITKRNNSLGYGFVEMEDEESAKKAIEGLHKKEIKGRAINVELTKERQPRPPRQPRVATSPSTSDSTAAPRAPKRAAAKRNGGEKKEGSNGEESKPVVSGDAENNTTGARRRNTRRPKTGAKPSDSPASPSATATTSTSSTGVPAERKAKAPRERKPREPKEKKVVEKDTTPREESKDTVFVYNLPFSYNDEQLLALFKDYTPKSAHVIINPRFKKSKGFGFVVFDNAEQQQKALAVDKTKVEERELNVRIALVDNKVPAATSPVATTETPAN
ncbi:RNA-binding region RNP-1 domain-containing protein [Cavenderia fasciculata]|uniref:RNA-binding region RNP-1 domain-containing protein n=1 Tax=Cavenderia fasciculata TaxID=261658 RepID=F4PWL0_CACFS|nr:RNA-binding region RNP-1 domain-containing protein [Cavenderia fasciculata]EGG20374.1 RNA-binding region RNP-1 domain-containing protein [Cavenderia fasciculata]|eukprot:XP_004367357.1 RNA-binding region RNP-1 domain-containing protein [Cavenderia fasciculata]